MTVAELQPILADLERRIDTLLSALRCVHLHLQTRPEHRLSQAEENLKQMVKDTIDEADPGGWRR